jgi:hypothetical protein
MQAKTRPRAAGTAKATPQGEDDESQLAPRNRQSEEQKRGRGSPSNKKSRRINNGEHNNHEDGCKHCGGRHNSKNCWELTENKDKRPDWWKPPEKRGNHNNNQGKHNKKEKTEQSNKIELSKEAFVRLVRHAQKGREKNGMEADNSEDDTNSIGGTAQYYENKRKSHSNNSNDSDSL